MDKPLEQPFECHLTISASNAHGTPVALLASQSGLTIAATKAAMTKGAVWLTRSDGKQATHRRRLRRLKAKLQAGDHLSLYYDADILNRSTDDATLVEDCNSYSIWQKPAGMFCEGSKWADHCCITRHIETRLQRSTYLTHRLDRYASGLIIIAHSKKTAAYFSELFRNREIEKHYQVVVEGQWKFANDEQKIEAIETPIDNKPALTYVSALDYNTEHNKSLLSVKIETGRKHQIRKHLAIRGYPVVGDRRYGPVKKTENSEINNENKPDLQLCACELSFNCPENNQLKNLSLDEKLRLQWPPARS